MRILVDDLSEPEIIKFLEEHVEEMKAVTPPQSKHALDLEGLRSPEITFWSVMDGDTLVGCGALKEIGPQHGEIKSMRTSPERKRQGIASVLIRHIIAEAKKRGYSRLSLETGSFRFFAPARSFYSKHGFSYCEPFADYGDDPNSVFMTKLL